MQVECNLEELATGYCGDFDFKAELERTSKTADSGAPKPRRKIRYDSFSVSR